MKELKNKLEAELRQLEAEILKDGLTTQRLDLLIKLEKALHHLPEHMEQKSNYPSMFETP